MYDKIKLYHMILFITIFSGFAESICDADKDLAGDRVSSAVLYFNFSCKCGVG